MIGLGTSSLCADCEEALNEELAVDNALPGRETVDVPVGPKWSGLRRCFPATTLQRYSWDDSRSVGLTAADADLLAEVGLPIEVRPYFRAGEIRSFHNPHYDHPVVEIGTSAVDPTATILIDPKDAAVWVAIAQDIHPPTFVNSRLDAFLYFLCRMPSSSDEYTRPKRETDEAIDKLRREMLAWDARALLDESWWSAIFLELEARLF
jgi:hypothetical protein